MRTKRTAREWIGFAIAIPVITVFSFLIHELAHYGAGEALGYDSWFNLNGAGLRDAVEPTRWEITIINMAGPAITISQAVIAAMLIRSRSQLWLYGFVIVAFWQRTMAFILSMIGMHNDEARVALLWDLPVWGVHALVAGGLGGLVIWAAYKARAGLIANLIAYVTTTAAITAIVLGSQAFPVRWG